MKDSTELYELKQRLLSKFPDRFLNVELTNRCNLRCPLCSTGSGFNKKQKGVMKFKEFKKFMDEYVVLADRVGLIGSGEPFLHPEIFTFIKYLVQEKQKEVICWTNGMLLKNFDEIVMSGLHEINIDVDGITQEQHASYRIGSELTKVLENIKRLVDTKKKLNKKTPQIFFDTLITKYNEYDYPSIIKQAREMKVDGIRIRTILDDIKKGKDWFPQQEKFKLTPKKNSGDDCNFKNCAVGILSWDGEIQLCCMSPNHPNPLIKLNAFHETNLLKALDSQKFYNLTKAAGAYPFCQPCSLFKYTGLLNQEIKFGLFQNTNLRKYLSLVAAILKRVFKNSNAV